MGLTHLAVSVERDGCHRFVLYFQQHAFENGTGVVLAHRKRDFGDEVFEIPVRHAEGLRFEHRGHFGIVVDVGAREFAGAVGVAQRQFTAREIELYALAGQLMREVAEQLAGNEYAALVRNVRDYARFDGKFGVRRRERERPGRGVYLYIPEHGIGRFGAYGFYGLSDRFGEVVSVT